MPAVIAYFSSPLAGATFLMYAGVGILYSLDGFPTSGHTMLQANGLLLDGSGAALPIVKLLYTS
jgi:hypothetical protein